MKSSILLVIVILVSCTSTDQDDQNPYPQAHELAGNWPFAVTYEIFVQSFYDTDGDGIGDLNGITEKLDYLKGLGIEALWLMPISPSPSYHKYDVTDYKDIHPDYGTKQDFKRLVKEAHDRNIKIVIDLVVNHTARDHPWFQEAIKNPKSKYRDYYVWAKRDSIVQSMTKEELQDDSDNPTNWHSVEGDDELYFGYFWGGMPDLNFDNLAVQQEIFEIGRFWLQEMDVDGFRLDAAKHIFTDDRATDNHLWWITFRKEMRKAKPDVFLVGEVWSDAEEVAPYLEGLPALFNFDVGRAITSAVLEEKPGDLVQRHKEIQEYYASINPDYIDAIFITNHDQNRIASEVNGDLNKARMAASLLLTLPGSPFIYYGEELGMLGRKPDENIREPFNWVIDGTGTGETSWISPEYTTDTTVAPLIKQLEDSLSMYHHYRRFIDLRNNSAVLTYGSMEPVEKNTPPAVCAFLRIYDQDSLWVLHNLSRKEQELVVQEPFTKFKLPIFSDGSHTIDTVTKKIVLPPYSSLILED